MTSNARGTVIPDMGACLFNPTEVALSDLRIAPLRTRREVRAFLDAYHHLGGRGVPAYKHALGVWVGYVLMGVGVFGWPRSQHLCKEGVLELYRFALIDALPRNSESYCLARMLKWLRTHGYREVITYSDPAQGHTGTIYKAVGFTCEGKAGGGTWANRPGRRDHHTGVKIRWRKLL